jgi:flagellar basal-body rod protein FlgG
MMRALWTAATGMSAQQMNVDLIANNLANVNTTGFKKSRIDFQDLLSSVLRPAGVESASGMQIPTGIEIGNGVMPMSTQRLFTQGDLTNTANPLDLVIEGEGFFSVLRPNGEIGYTKNGAFKPDGEGRLVTGDGYALQPEITIPTDAKEVYIGVDGTVSVLLSGQEEPQVIGNIELVTFANPAGLKSAGHSLFEPTGASGDAVTGTPGEDGFGTILQGFLEMSNVKVVEEMINMIVGQRAYEINGKAITAADEMLSTATRLR